MGLRGRRATARWAASLSFLVATGVVSGCGARSALEQYFSGDGQQAAGGGGAGASGGFGAGGLVHTGGTVGAGGALIDGGGPSPLAHAPDPRSEPPTFCTKNGWCGSNADFMAISGTSDTDIWILASDTGSLSNAGAPADPAAPISAEPVRQALLHWDGLSWTATQPDPALLPPGIRLLDIAAASPTDVWAVGEAATVLRFDGDTWQDAPGPYEGTLTTVEARVPWDVWIGGSADWIWNFHDEVKWSDFPLYTWGGVTDISRAPESLWVVGLNLLEPASFGPGSNVHGLTSIWHDDDKVVFGAGNAGALGRWLGAADWVYESGNLGFGSIDFRAVWGHSETDVWAVGEAGALAHFDGASWKAAVAVTSRDLNGVWGTSTGTWAVGDDGTFLSLEGGSWNASQPTTESLRALWGSAESDVWAAGDDLVHFDGGEWVQVAHPAVPELLALSGTGPSDVWAVGREGTALHWDGELWTALPIPTSFDVNGVWARNEGDVWAVSQDGITWRAAGDTWTGSAPAVAPALRTVFGSDEGDVIVSGEGLRRVWEGGTWFDFFSDESEGEITIFSVSFGDGEHIWTGGWVGPSGPKASTQRPWLSRWDGQFFVDSFEPGPEFGLMGNPIQAGWASAMDNLWIACPSVMVWDGATWRYSSVGGSEQVVALYGAGQDLWAITHEGNLVRRRLP